MLNRVKVRYSQGTRKETRTLMTDSCSAWLKN
eukprot:SAG31_NODE_18341_length_640_cov_0.561922_1_plen_31_part_01